FTVGQTVETLFKQKRAGRLPQIPIVGATEDPQVQAEWDAYDKWIRHQGPRPHIAGFGSGTGKETPLPSESFDKEEGGAAKHAVPSKGAEPSFTANVEFIFSGDVVRTLGHPEAHIAPGEKISVAEIQNRFTAFSATLSNDCEGFCIVIAGHSATL